MKKINVVLIGLLAFFGFYGCDADMYHYFVVENISEKDLKVNFNHIGENDSTLVINRAETDTVYLLIDFGGSHIRKRDIKTAFSSFNVTPLPDGQTTDCLPDSLWLYTETSKFSAVYLLRYE